MKTLIFTLAVIGASIYLGYSQSANLRQWANQNITPQFHELSQQLDVPDMANRMAEHSPGMTERLQKRIATLEQEVTRLNRELTAVTTQLEGSWDAQHQMAESVFTQLQEEDLTYVTAPSQSLNESTNESATQPTSTLSNRDRSAALLALAERMELKAISH